MALEGGESAGPGDPALGAGHVLKVSAAYTGELERARRRRPTSTPVEVQLSLLPPRLAG